jgi:N-methylhydantoinase A/oxoprolinase/acetone carboxylase beta subunit
MATSLNIATDVGGTFTDVVKLWTNEDGSQRLEVGKGNTTPHKFEEGVMNLLKGHEYVTVATLITSILRKQLTSSFMVVQ